jgi:hypothetical protein
MILGLGHFLFMAQKALLEGYKEGARWEVTWDKTWGLSECTQSRRDGVVEPSAQG